MKKMLSVLALTVFFGSDALSSDDYFDAQLDVCAGWKRASDYSFDARQMQRLREIERYMEQARQAMLDHPRLSWFGLTPDERCQATRAQERSGNFQRWMDKNSMGINY